MYQIFAFLTMSARAKLMSASAIKGVKIGANILGFYLGLKLSASCCIEGYHAPIAVFGY